MTSTRTLASSSISSHDIRPHRGPSKILLVLFDAFDTLLFPDPLPHVQYAEEARLHLSELCDPPALTDEAIRTSFRQAFKQTWKEHPLYGAHTGILSVSADSLEATPREEDGVAGKRWTGPDAWWALVIKRTFEPALSLSSPSSSRERPSKRSDVRQSLVNLQNALLSRFASRRAYKLFSDVEPALEALRTDYPDVKLGVASNSDSRILQAMHELGLGRSLNLQLEDDSQQEQDQQPRHSAKGPPPTLSYTILAEKPSARFFELAINRAEPFVLSSRSSASTGREHDAEDGKRQQLRADQVLFVGDHLLEDFRAARDAGLHALWLRRAPLADDAELGKDGSAARFVGPHNEDAERTLEQEGLSEEERMCTISSMLGVVEWLQERRRNGM